MKTGMSFITFNFSSLTTQLQKLQNLVGKVTGMSGVSSPKGSTCLMVMVLSFALFLGTWSPLTGYGMGQHSMGPLALPVSRSMGGIRGGIASTLARDASKVPMGPQLGDAYSTPNVRSRVLMSIKDEGEETAEYAPHLPFTYKDLFIHWFSSEATASAMMPHSSDGVTVHFDAPMTPNVEVTDKDLRQDQPVRPSLQSDMAANVLMQVVSANVNATS
ncbi:hypothetical protein LSAT2_009774 [Lamellibrachia satsuma]|nr:hypothetical protein LSAT2_009774 [Lamellibrachia satsuma]